MPKTHVTEGKSKALKISDDKVHRVCAYCRVSTDEYDQRNSLMVQKEFFESYFEEHPNWINVGIFADEGLSGTSLKKRDEFNRMISIAKHGGIDIILPKNVNVKSNAVGIFGGVENKNYTVPGAEATVYITGAAIFGGVDIKS